MSGLNFTVQATAGMLARHCYTATARMGGGTLVQVQGYNMADRVELMTSTDAGGPRILCLSCSDAQALARQLNAAALTCSESRGR